MIHVLVFALAKQLAKNRNDKAAKERAFREEQAAVAARQRIIADRAKRCCAACGVEVTRGIAFCHSCGGSKMITRGEFLDHKAEAVQAQAARTQKEKERRQAEEKHRQAAVRRCQELLSWRYCEPCFKVFESTHKFCTQCGQSTQELPRAFALEYARNDFPDLIESQTDFDGLS